MTKRSSRIEEAMNLEACGYCRSSRGDPCREPSFRTCPPHKDRIKIEREKPQGGHPGPFGAPCWSPKA